MNPPPARSFAGPSSWASTSSTPPTCIRLGVDAIDLYQIHRLDHRTPFEETLAALDHLVQSGKVRYLGASSMFAWQLRKAISLSERNGWARYVCMQDHYNLLYREEEREMLPLCLE